MEYYVDITLKTDAEMRANELLNKVYAKLHKELCDLQATDVGVSFPHYQVLLGNVLRIHSSEFRLTPIQAGQWLGGLIGYCDVGALGKVPENSQHRTVSRKQANMTASKLRRLCKRGSITDEEAKKYRAKMYAQGLDNPYVELESNSNGHRHRRFIEFGPLLDAATEGRFDQFGLSRTATIPWF